jgi:hypothetical protein
MVDPHEIFRALKILQDYLVEFPEHNQADLRIFQAAEILEIELCRTDPFEHL